MSFYGTHELRSGLIADILARNYNFVVNSISYETVAASKPKCDICNAEYTKRRRNQLCCSAACQTERTRRVDIRRTNRNRKSGAINQNVFCSAEAV